MLRVETMLATAHATKVERRDAEKSYHWVPREWLATHAPGFEWDAWFDAIGLADVHGPRRVHVDGALTLGENLRDESLRTMVSVDPHAPPRVRVNGVLGNTPELAQTFGCAAGRPMVHAPRCEVW